ncbi:adenylate/guanylate cyclase domain-containing protein [Bradyrhizobium sp. G127]|uniref:adenylate/guanylate cyclase domain-containing protein n=1 Tax=Bradyrhizobium sp. G127 TaxID=2904800 RepID=UPI001F31B2E8|nr:adenylate/guanylate cyclase domain-containing protein [Bradyrhizobium sp. G127]MCF2522316.1 adenylate/guanylate cyclase domain-containing protein [Bradyrhizobium sp. G127]
MAEKAVSPFTRHLRGIGLRQVRLASGIVLFSYIASHFINHALGNVSIAAMEDFLNYQMLFWQSWPVLTVFYGAVLIHMGLGLWALYARRQFRWTRIEVTQLLFGLSIPPLILSHFVGVRLASPLFGIERDYPQVFFAHWVSAPDNKWFICAVLLIAWVHGCIGLYFWFRSKPYFKKISSLLLAIAVIVPTLALLGLYQGGRTIVRASAAPEWRADNLSAEKTGTAAQQELLGRITLYAQYGYFGLIGLVIAARGVRLLRERRRGLVKLSYGNGKTIRIPVGLTVLEASTRFNIPHSSVCGGRARCSTCRIRVIGDCSALPEPSNRETFVLDRVGAGGDPAIRLACQLRPTSDIAFFQIFPPHASPSAAARTAPVHPGKERYVVSMFVDMRGSTKLAEQLLPFDTVFVINRFLTAVSQAVVECGGQPNQFVGDGQLALFGLATHPQTACRQAIEAAARIAVRVDALNEFLGEDVPEPLRFGIGIHGGEVIIGDIGSQEHMVFTALGDSVNVAARLQDMTKTLSCEVVLSQDVLKTAGVPAGDLPRMEVPIRGRVEPLVVHTAEKAGTLSAITAHFAVAAA